MAKLTNEEVQTLQAKREIHRAIESWMELFTYLMGLVDKDSQQYVDENVRERLKIDDSIKLRVELDRGIVEPLEDTVVPIKAED